MSNRAAGLRPEKISKQVLKFKVDCLYIICSSVIDYFEVFLLQNKKNPMWLRKSWKVMGSEKFLATPRISWKLSGDHEK